MDIEEREKTGVIGREKKKHEEMIVMDM